MPSAERTSGSARVVVAMSGGVDSSVAALLLARTGAEVLGLFMRNGVKVEASEAARKSCCSIHDARDARMVAAHLGIPFQAVDLGVEFGSIMRYFADEYARGRTPNPCAVCNRDLKFQRLVELADELGAEAVATGHYCRVQRRDGRVVLQRGVDPAKDQSYQMFAVPEAQLARARFPVGELPKARVRELAREAGLRTAAKADSQEICFVPSNDYRQFLAQRGQPLHPGRLVDSAGRVLGEHGGTEWFTIGQRRGHGVGGGTPLYVIALEPATGTVVLGTREECCSPATRVSRLNWIGFDAPASFRASVQVRYHHDPVSAQIECNGSVARVQFDEPVLAVTPGQGAAFYDGDRLLGGGWIEGEERAGAARRG